ncbi:MAG: 2-hydroxychromene-2-carboxylate isomerase [Pseudomonadota bacterium]|nr:2-hydroxychromene-2-carboxylate isomerase [Pseudomonadota bacterium]
MSRKLEYFFDCSSPWTYLSFRGILELRKNKEFEIIWKPILVGGIFNSTNPSVYESRKNPVKEKMEYSQKDMADWAAERNIQFNWPKIFPINSVKSMRGSFYFLDKNQNIEEYLEKVFKAYWTEGKDISSNDCLKDIVTSLSASADDFMEFIDLPETKKRLVDNTQELMDRNGFGSPTFFLDTEDMYFGNDRIQLIKNKL